MSWSLCKWPLSQDCLLAEIRQSKASLDPSYLLQPARSWLSSIFETWIWGISPFAWRTWWSFMQWNQSELDHSRQAQLDGGWALGIHESKHTLQSQPEQVNSVYLCTWIQFLSRSAVLLVIRRLRFSSAERHRVLRISRRSSSCMF